MHTIRGTDFHSIVQAVNMLWVGPSQISWHKLRSGPVSTAPALIKLVWSYRQTPPKGWKREECKSSLSAIQLQPNGKQWKLSRKGGTQWISARVDAEDNLGACPAQVGNNLVARCFMWKTAIRLTPAVSQRLPMCLGSNFTPIQLLTNILSCWGFSVPVS